MQLVIISQSALVGLFSFEYDLLAVSGQTEPLVHPKNTDYRKLERKKGRTHGAK